jgi:hypothetical protein
MTTPKTSPTERVQAKNVPEDVILAYLRERPGRWHSHWYYEGVDPEWSMTAARPELREFPEKVLVAKLRAMVRKGLIDGCTCGRCRGDWHVVE